ncbi:HD-GYP domain-containing protein [Actinacidiphila paucisporea]|uniref:HD domain-containing protein n=1 Tax=Actinacidiphila paucisporea TaxID=310782 RepID=A0A1M6V1M8_9ACTN|nr:HD-GYP domain-containing protein [Actinacidiphila paucisporea]SHK75399.1 HD domain-containing protein [Actinacidiphila paucisporea]
MSAVPALVAAMQLKDPYTRAHGDRVGQASALIGVELRLADDLVAALRLAGTLHDIGKLGVPGGLLRKTGPLTAAERQTVQRHPGHGYALVRDTEVPAVARVAVLHHHERLDGRGYPHGLAGRRIPWPARVVSVADALDAMTSTRSYRPARPVATALAELWRCAGSQFDPSVVEALTRALARHPWPPPGPLPALPAAPGGHCAYL